MLPIALVSISEHIGDHMALSSIIDKDLTKDPGLDRTLLGDGLATTFAGLVGGPANTTYGENTSIVGMSRVASVWVIGLAAIISICLAFFGKITALFQTIPDEVLGGVSLLLYGFISVNGLKVLIENNTDFNNLRNIVIVSSMLIFGLGGAIITLETKNLAISLTGMSLSAIVGIILNIVLKDPNEQTILKLKVSTSLTPEYDSNADIPIAWPKPIKIVKYFVYWLNFSYTASPPSFFISFNFGVVATINWTIIEDVIYGMIPSAKIEQRLIAPPENRLNIPNIPLFVISANDDSLFISTTGTGT